MDKSPSASQQRPKFEAGSEKAGVRRPLPEGLKVFGRVADDASRRGASNGDVRRFRSLRKPQGLSPYEFAVYPLP